MTSPDLIHWENRGVALLPTGKYENCGCYSGTAISEGDTIYFAYTGNYRDENRIRRPHQLLATLEGDEQYTKAMRPLITPMRTIQNINVIQRLCVLMICTISS